MLKKGIKTPNPKKAFLTNLSKIIKKWRKEGKQHEVILMADMNECININGDLWDFCLENDRLDTVGLLNLLKPMTRHIYTAQNILFTSLFRLHYHQWRCRRFITNSINTLSLTTKEYTYNFWPGIYLIAKLWIGATNPIDN